MKLKDVSQKTIKKELKHGFFLLKTGPFLTKIKSTHTGFFELLMEMYAENEYISNFNQQLYHFSIQLEAGKGIHLFWNKQVIVKTDSTPPFTPFPHSHAFLLFEWCLNWCIALQSHQYLMLHAAVVEKDNQAILLPAEPGSGKSTLSAALMLDGWRLLSDEFALYDIKTKLVTGLGRPIPLKNESIEIIRQYSKQAILGPTFEKTRKGNVAHLKPTTQSVEKMSQPIKITTIIFPQYHIEGNNQLDDFAIGRAFLKVTGNSFNYRLQGARGFNAVADLVENSKIFNLKFNDLSKAIQNIEQIS